MGKQEMSPAVSAIVILIAVAVIGVGGWFFFFKGKGESAGGKSEAERIEIYKKMSGGGRAKAIGPAAKGQ